MSVTEKCFFILVILMIFMATDRAQGQHPNSIHTTYEHVILEGDRADWNLARFWYQRDFEKMTSLIRLRYADRFNRSAYMLESDVYPEFSDRSYALVGVGVSLSNRGLFPNIKARGTYFRNLSSSVVAGLGIRYLSFDIDDVFIYKADLSWYLRDFLILSQGFLQVRKKKPLATAVVTVRKYLEYPAYLFLKLGYGQSPQGLRFEEDVLDTFESIFISVGGEFRLTERLGANAALQYRKNTFSEFTSRNRYGLTMGISWRF